jgi:hypothetical protein
MTDLQILETLALGYGEAHVSVDTAKRQGVDYDWSMLIVRRPDQAWPSPFRYELAVWHEAKNRELDRQEAAAFLERNKRPDPGTAIVK